MKFQLHHSPVCSLPQHECKYYVHCWNLWNMPMLQPQQMHSSLTPTPLPMCTWQVMSRNLFSFDGDEWLLVKNFIQRFHLYTISHKENVVQWKLSACWKKNLVEYDVPEQLQSDNGLQYTSALLWEFGNKWNFVHPTSSPPSPPVEWVYRVNGDSATCQVQPAEICIHLCCTTGAYLFTPICYHQWELLFQWQIHLNLPA